MATPVTVWGKTRKIIGGLIISAFIFPFFAVSCDGMDVVTISGGDLVGGCEPDRLGGSLDDDMPGGGAAGGAKADVVDVEPLAIAALVLALTTFALAFLGSRKALIASLGLSIAALGILGGLWVTVNGKLDKLVEDSRKQNEGNRMRREVKIDSGGRAGLYGCAAGFLALAVFTGLALRPQPPPGALPQARVLPPPDPPPG